MCGRITQTRSVREYAKSLGIEPEMLEEHLSRQIGNYNGAPGAAHWTLRTHDGNLLAEPVVWHYLSGWARKKGLAPAINAQLEKLLTPYYRSMMKTGRIIVPADGWYEWTGKAGAKQPWYIKAKNDKPLFFAGLTNHHPDLPDPEGAGFVIVTDDVAGGMLDVHDRRPVALTPGHARLWLDPDTSYEQAAEIARTSELGEDYFEWYRVGVAVNQAGRQGASLICPLSVR